MAGGSWNVIRCTACSTCHGHRSMGATCPHCGQKLADSAEVIAKVDSASQLRIEVALANTPEQLRETLRARLEENTALFTSEQPVSHSFLSSLVIRSADENGVLKQVTLQALLDKSSPNVDATDLIEMAETQGMLVRVGNGTWQLLE